MIRWLDKGLVAREEQSRDLNPDISAPETMHLNTEVYCPSEEPGQKKDCRLQEKYTKPGKFIYIRSEQFKNQSKKTIFLTIYKNLLKESYA